MNIRRKITLSAVAEKGQAVAKKQEHSPVKDIAQVKQSVETDLQQSLQPDLQPAIPLNSPSPLNKSQSLAESPEKSTDKLSEEQNLQGKLEQLDLDIRALAVVDGNSYQMAGEMGVSIKNMSKEIKSYFKPSKDLAHAQHKELCQKEKSYLDPLKDWESTLKAKMNGYQVEVNRHKEAMALRIAEEKKAEEQVYLEKIQDLEEVGALEEVASLELEMSLVGQVMDSMVVEMDPPKQKGVSVKKQWKIKSIREELVPVSLGGVVIRPVNHSEILKLVKQYQGNIEIPGVEFVEEDSVQFRGGTVS